MQKTNQTLAAIDHLIGSAIRARRLEMGLSLKDVGSSTGLSIGLLSQIERGLSSPSVRSLNLVANALNVSPAWIFDSVDVELEQSDIVVRKDQRWTVNYAEGITKQVLTRQGTEGLELLLVVMEPHASSGADFYSHEGLEAGLVMLGSLLLFVDSEVFRLKEGDSFKFRSTIPHRFENPGEKESQVLWALTTPSYV